MAEDTAEELPEGTVAEAERLTRLAREAIDDEERAAYLRDRGRLLAEFDYEARLREEDDTLVLHPTEWITGGTVYPEEIDDIDRGVEVSLSGPGDPDEWDAVEDHNATIVERVREDGDEVHAANVRAFADFMGNHYARRVETASAAEIEEFLSEYFPRNAWPSDEQKEVVAESIELAFEVADAESPRLRRETR